MPQLIWTPYSKAMTEAGLRFGRNDFIPWQENLQRGLKSPDPDIDQDIKAVSREHVRISPTQGGLRIEDCSSTLGTYVNGQKLTSARMVAWDDLAATTIYMGAPCFCLRFLLVDTYVEVTSSGKELDPLPLSGATRIWLVVVGRYKRKLEAVVKLIHEPEPSEQPEELDYMTISPDEFYGRQGVTAQPSPGCDDIELIMPDTPDSVS